MHGLPVWLMRHEEMGACVFGDGLNGKSFFPEEAAFIFMAGKRKGIFQACAFCRLFAPRA
ncbi:MULTISPECIES: hypothetical protein [Ottowia]|jgi:hypothetical protein|uniref:Uncharacterized protein n=1 Tax=Ottowia cancrivicina TaxID=3040346 RepID=A0AAW6RM86_9BURK|nr:MULTISPECIES: hypothetical protein [Ottowia]MDG9699952.1 hypothetical protein [Ottowia sp. 10c7w1]